LRTVEREKSAAFTSSHQAAMLVLAQIAAELGERNGAAGTSEFREALERLPGLVAGVLAREAEIEPVAARAVEQRIYAAGPGPNAATALEAVIKVREAAYGWIDALPLEQFLHGPIVAVNAADFSRSTVRKTRDEPGCSAVKLPMERTVAPAAPAIAIA